MERRCFQAKPPSQGLLWGEPLSWGQACATVQRTLCKERETQALRTLKTWQTGKWIVVAGVRNLLHLVFQYRFMGFLCWPIHVIIIIRRHLWPPSRPPPSKRGVWHVCTYHNPTRAILCWLSTRSQCTLSEQFCDRMFLSQKERCGMYDRKCLLLLL